MDHRILEMEEYAKVHHIPIMLKDGIEFMCDYIKDHQIKNILEIGTAIGYSAICMASVDSNIHVTTIERDEVRYCEALLNIGKVNMEDQITVMFDDALNVTVSGEYDLIFIDAAKSQYIKFFERFSPFLKKGGVVFSDNLDFHGLIHSEDEISSKNLKGLVRKINQYIDFLKNNSDYDTTFYSVGDGIGVSVKK